MVRWLVSFTLALGLFGKAAADVWWPVVPWQTKSANGRFLLELKDGQPSQASLKEDGAEHWTADLHYERSPLHVLVSNDGHFVVGLDNWRCMGFGDNVVACYGAEGQLLFQRSLEELLSAEHDQSLVASGSVAR